MTDEPYIRWEDRRNRTPKGMLQTTYPLTPAEDALAQTVGEDAVREFIAFPAPPLKPGEIDLVRAMVVDGFSLEEIVQTIRPPVAPRWRWYRDPLVIGAAVRLAVVIAAFIWGRA